MTILEMNIYNTLLAVEAEKAERNIEPIHSLLIQDRLQERVEERIGQPITHTEFYHALQSLHHQCKIHLGDTTRDQYAKVVYQEIISSL